MVIGASDAGKTSLVTWLANHLAARKRVAILDADVGQSEIGPPTTLGLGAVRPPLARPADAELVALHFVGATTSAVALRATFDGVRRLVARARRDAFARILIDTSGLVAGRFGRVVVDGQIEAAGADLVVALQRAGECEHILAPYAGRVTPRIVRVPALGGFRPRTARARREHRDHALARWLAGARLVTLDLTRVALTAAGAEPADPAGLVAGLQDAEGETLGIGVIRSIDAAAQTLAIETAVPPERIATVVPGRARRL